jgi:predicted PurR-regulated permease PerM
VTPPDPHNEHRRDAQADRDFIARAARVGIIGAAVLLALAALLWVLKAALTPLAVAFVIAYLLDPLIDRLEARGVRRRIAIFLLLGLAGAVLLSFLLLVIPGLIRELSELAERMPGYLERLVTQVVPRIETQLGIELPGTVEELLGQLRGAEMQALGTLRDVLVKTASTVTGTVGILIGLLVIPILAYYLLLEFDSLVARLGSQIPPRHRPYVYDQ